METTWKKSNIWFDFSFSPHNRISYIITVL